MSDDPQKTSLLRATLPKTRNTQQNAVFAQQASATPAQQESLQALALRVLERNSSAQQARNDEPKAAQLPGGGLLRSEATGGLRNLIVAVLALQPFWKMPKGTLGEAQAALLEWVKAQLRASPGKSAEELATTLVVQHGEGLGETERAQVWVWYIEFIRRAGCRVVHPARRGVLTIADLPAVRAQLEAQGWAVKLGRDSELACKPRRPWHTAEEV